MATLAWNRRRRLMRFHRGGGGGNKGGEEEQEGVRVHQVDLYSLPLSSKRSGGERASEREGGGGVSERGNSLSLPLPPPFFSISSSPLPPSLSISLSPPLHLATPGNKSAAEVIAATAAAPQGRIARDVDARAA